MSDLIGPNRCAHCGGDYGLHQWPCIGERPEITPEMKAAFEKVKSEMDAKKPMTEKTPPLPVSCACCGKDPGQYEGKVFCKTFGCLSDANCPRDPVNWNLWNERLATELHSAFEAGRADGNPRNGWHDCCEWKYPTFDDYLAERKA